MLAFNGFRTSSPIIPNVPSGAAEPGEQDKIFTKNLVIASKATGITCFDHIIIGVNHYFSFADEGLIEEYDIHAVT